MNQRELDIKRISSELAKWEVDISNLNSIDLYDANSFSEFTVCELLNCIFDYELKNVNEFKRNHPAIDLGDKINRIAVQVTSSQGVKKIQHTINKFIDYRLFEDYDELFILILGKKQRSYSNFTTNTLFEFDKNKNIIDFQDLLRHINFLPEKKIDKLRKILSIEETAASVPLNVKAASSKLKRNLALKKRLQKDLLRKISTELYHHAAYEP